METLFHVNGPTLASFIVYFWPFQTNIIIIFTTNIWPSSIQWRDSNPQPSEHEHPPITTRPGLPLNCLVHTEMDLFILHYLTKNIIFVCNLNWNKSYRLLFCCKIYILKWSFYALLTSFRTSCPCRLGRAKLKIFDLKYIKIFESKTLTIITSESFFRVAVVIDIVRTLRHVKSCRLIRLLLIHLRLFSFEPLQSGKRHQPHDDIEKSRLLCIDLSKFVRPLWSKNETISNVGSRALYA